MDGFLQRDLKFFWGLVFMSFLILGCNPAEVEDKERFQKEPPPPPTTASISFTTLSDLQVFEGSVITSNLLACSSTESTLSPQFSVAEDEPLGNCKVEGRSEYTIVCRPPLLSGHEERTVRLTVVCSIDDVHKEQSITLTILDYNRPPSLKAIQSQEVFAGTSIERVDASSPSGLDSDEDGDLLTYNCTFIGGNTVNPTDCSTLPQNSFAFDETLGILDWNPSPSSAVDNQKTTYTITIMGSDAQSTPLTDSVTFTVAVDIVAPPTFSSILPTSPSNNPAPLIKGSSSEESSTISLFSDSSCSTVIGSGSKATFEENGITANVRDNASTDIYARAYDSENHSSECVLMTAYTHDDIAPSAPTFLSTTPTSPSKSSMTPLVKGMAPNDAYQIHLFSDSSCISSLSSANASVFTGAGVLVNLTANSSNSLYGQTVDRAGNRSNCTSLTTYIHDNEPPEEPTFTAFVPSSPTNQTQTPKIQGSVLAESVLISFFSDDECQNSLGSGTRGELTGDGITLTLTANSQTTVYGESQDLATNESSCTFMGNFTHDNQGPENPTFGSLSPASPSSNSAPKITGSINDSDCATVQFYKDVGCQNLIGTGTKAAFIGVGITLSVTTNSTTSIYAKTFDALGNGGNCVMMDSYTHDSTPPAIPTFSSTDPASPSNSERQPIIKGSASTDTVLIKIFTSGSCLVAQEVGSGDLETFEESGIELSVALPVNQSSTLYGKSYDLANNSSACSYLTTYQHDSTPPDDPVFVSITPVSPNNSSTNPVVRGTLSADSVTVDLFTDVGCSVVKSSGSKTLFETSGLATAVTANSSTTVYGKSYDLAGNSSSCEPLTTYTHDSLPPSNPPVFSSFTLTSPNSNPNPKIVGTADLDTATVVIYSGSSCSSAIGSGTRADFVGAGITLNLPINATTAIYAKAFDDLGNGGGCAFQSNFTHDNFPPSAPTFSSAVPSSPTNSDLTPTIKGGSSVDSITIKIFHDDECTVELGSGSKSDFETGGITLATDIDSNSVNSLYGQSFDLAGNGSACSLLTTYTHDSTPPADPLFFSITPSSPNNSSITPQVIGILVGDSTLVTLYTDPLCDTAKVSGSKATFEGVGLPITVTANVTTSIYGEASDAAGNVSSCTLLSAYEHDNTGPTNPGFTSFDPASPSSNSSPKIIGTASADTANLTFYLDGGCNNPIGSGTKAQFIGAGVTLSAVSNGTTTVYVKAFDALGNGGSCVSMQSYAHDNLPPANPSFVSTNPASPSNSSTTPSVIGSASADTDQVHLYDDEDCLSLLASGTRGEFVGGGISINATSNDVTTLYAKVQDSVGNSGSCTYLSDYRHDNIPPADPTFSSFSPASPTNVTINPSILGGASADTSTLSFYSNVGCTLSLGSGTRAQFVGTGIAITGTANAVVDVYGKSFDSAGNGSNCTALSSFTHDSNPPVDPSLTAFDPVSPSDDSSPAVKGSCSADSVTLNFFRDINCSLQIGTGSKAQYEGAGISISVLSNATTSVYAKAYDLVGNGSGCLLLGSYLHDNTPPISINTVTDGTYLSSTTSSPTLNWTVSGDSGSGLSHYMVAIGSSAGAQDISNWSNVGLVTNGVVNGINPPLVHGQVYYATVKAIDSVGNSSVATHGDGWIVDTTAPSDVVVTAVECTKTTLEGNWTASSDGESGLQGYLYSLGTTAGNNNVKDWSSLASGITTISLSDLNLTIGQTYFLNVKAQNYAGGMSNVSNDSVECADLSDSLKAYWKMEEASGDRISSVGGHHLSDINSVDRNNGKVGFSAVFIGGNSELLQMSSHSDLEVADEPFTLSFWVYLENNSSDQVLMSKWGVSSEYIVDWQSSNHLRLRVGTGEVSINTTLNNQTWYHILASHSSTDNQLSLQINNGPATTANYSDGTSSGASLFEIGGYSVGGSYMTGRVDGVGVWKRLLTANEKSELYNNGNGSEYPF